MQRVTKLKFSLAILGFAVTAVIYIAGSLVHAPENPTRVEAVLGVISLILCPPGLLAVPLFDIDPYTRPGVVLWLIIASMNSGLYAAAGVLLARRFCSMRNGREER
jgi:hypothetical protein